MYRWHALLGKFRFEEESVVFQGETTTLLDQPAAAIGNAISDQRFSGGTLRGTVRFSEIGAHSARKPDPPPNPETRDGSSKPKTNDR